MITPKVKETKVILGPCRLSYVHLFEKYVPEGTSEESGKYCASILIPKSEKQTIKAIEKAIEAAKKQAIVSKWGGKEPKKLDCVLRDGDEDKEDDEIYADKMFINAKSSSRPGIIDKDKSQIVDEDEVYSGMWAVVSITFYGYSFSGSNGIACYLNNVMKYKDDERFGGHESAESDFEDVEFDNEDDDDL